MRLGGDLGQAAVAALALFFSPITTAVILAGQICADIGPTGVVVTSVIATSAQMVALRSLEGRARVGYLLPYALLSWPVHLGEASTSAAVGLFVPGIPAACLAQFLLLAGFTNALTTMGAMASPMTCLVLIGVRFAGKGTEPLATFVIALGFSLTQVWLVKLSSCGRAIAPLLGYFTFFSGCALHLLFAGVDVFVAFIIFPYAYYGSFFQCGFFVCLCVVSAMPDRRSELPQYKTP